MVLQRSNQKEPQMNSRDNKSRLGATGRMTLTASSESSPFYVPEDSEIFRMKEKEKDRKKEQRLNSQTLKIWEKGIKPREGLTMKELNQMAKAQPNQDSDNPTKISLIQAAKSAIKNRVRNTQPMHEFIEKKREMLLFQMLIDHKREQINQFEELTRLHRKGLQKAEQMLEEDMQAFNDHLNDNKRQAREKIKLAQEKTRDKNRIVADIKQKQEIKADLTGRNTSKLETLQSLKTYKDFLDGLNPELTEEQRRKKQQRRQDNQKTIAKSNLNISPQMMQFLLDEDDQQDMYFKDPSQIVNIFLNLQESNLFLITNLKSIEQSIETVRAHFAKKRKILDAKKEQLLNTKAEISKQIAVVEKEIDHIQISTHKDDFGQLFNKLESDVISMYKQQGQRTYFDQKAVSGLELLKQIQKRLQLQVKTLNQARQQKPALIQTLERACNNEKREKKKLKNEQQTKQLAMQQKIQQAPKKQKRIGRPIMAKSKLKVEQKEEKVEDEGPKQEEIERRKYLT